MSDLTNKIEFPVIDYEKLEDGSLPKGEIEGQLDKMLQFLLHVNMLKSTSYLAKDTLDKAREVDDKLGQLKKRYPQLIGVVQNILGRKIKEMAGQSSDSKTLFNRLRILTAEAEFQSSLQEWKEADLNKVPVGLTKSFLVKLYDPRTHEARYFLPKNWRHPVHKRTALILRDLSFKAREAYKTERGITDPLKSEPEKTVEPEVLIQPETPQVPEIPADKPTKTKKPRDKKSKSKDETTDKTAATQKKKVAAKIRDEEDEADIRQIKSTKDFRDLEFLKK